THRKFRMNDDRVKIVRDARGLRAQGYAPGIGCDRLCAWQHHERFFACGTGPEPDEGRDRAFANTALTSYEDEFSLRHGREIRGLDAHRRSDNVLDKSILAW